MTQGATLVRVCLNWLAFKQMVLQSASAKTTVAFTLEAVAIFQLNQVIQALSQTHSIL